MLEYFEGGGADSSDEGAIIRFSGYYKCQKYPKKVVVHLPMGRLAYSDGDI